MPIIDVTVVRDKSFVMPQDAASELANGLARVFDAPEGRVWVRLHTHPAAAYAENGPCLAGGDGPTFVTVLHATPPSAEALEREAQAVCATVAAVLGCPIERVHAEYAPAGRGRMAFGGQLLR